MKKLFSEKSFVSLVLNSTEQKVLVAVEDDLEKIGKPGALL